MLNKPNQELPMDICVDSDWGGVVDAGDDLRKSTSRCLVYVAGVGRFLQPDTETTSFEQLRGGVPGNSVRHTRVLFDSEDR